MIYYKKYRDRINTIGNDIRIDKNTNIPVQCNKISCHDCLRFVCDRCSDAALLKWACTEYVEPPVDWAKVEVDTPVLVSNSSKDWYKRYFARYENGKIYAWNNGLTSWSAISENYVSDWALAKLAEKE